MNERSLPQRLFLIASILGAIYLATEAVLQSFGKSICATASCRLVASYSRFDDILFVLAGLGVLSLLAVLSGQELRRPEEPSGRLISLLLIAALAAEGFLVGYQLFWIRTLCIFCISVLGIFLLLSLLRIASGDRAVLAGFAALAAVLALFFLLRSPAGAPLPREAKHLLFSSDDCRHCAEIRTEIGRAGLEVQVVQAKEHAALLRGLGIEHVPVLLVRGTYERTFLTGAEAIRQYLAACCPQPGAQKPAPKRKAPAGAAAPGAPAGPFSPFLLPAPAGSFLSPTTDAGLCKQDQQQEKCDQPEP